MGRLIYMDNSNREVVVPFGPDQPVVTIGRATDCVIRSNRRSVSRHHAEFRYLNGQYEVVDLGSANGTYLIINENRQRIEGRLALSHSDEVWCGDFILYFEEEDEYYEPLPYEGGGGVDDTYGDHNPVMSYDDGGYQNPPMYDAPAAPAAPPGPQWNSNPGAAPFATSSEPAPYNPNVSGNYGAEPYSSAPIPPAAPAPPAVPVPPHGHHAPEPYQSPSGNYGAEPYDPNGVDYYDEPEPAIVEPGKAPFSTAPHSPVAPISGTYRHAEPAPVAGPSQHEYDTLQDRLDQLQMEVDSGHRERDQLRNEIDRAHAAPVQDDERVQELESQLAIMAEELKTAHQSASADAALVAKNEALETQLKEGVERIEGYRRRITLAEEEATRAARLRDDLMSREKDIEQLHQELDRNREEMRLARDEARKARESAERARSSLQTAERGAQEGLDLKKEIERQRRLLDEIERRNRDLSHEFSELETLSKELEQMLEQKTSDAESLRVLANNHEKRLGELTQDGSRSVQDLKKTRIALDEALHNAERFELMSQQLDAELKALQQSSSTQITDLTQKLDVSSRDSSVSIAKLTNQLDRLTIERDELQVELEATEPEQRALKSEIEGLKQRLRMEKDRARKGEGNADELGELKAAHELLTAELELAKGEAHMLKVKLDAFEQASSEQPPVQQIDLAEVEQLRNHNQSLRERLQNMERHLDDVGAQATVDVPALRGGAPEQAGKVIELLEALDRVVDAIARTDLSGLGTVDRIRLQSALRDTDPRATLERARELLRQP